MGQIVASEYGCPLITLGEDPGGYYTYVPYKLCPLPVPKPPIIIEFVYGTHFFQFDLIDQTQGEFQMLLSQLLFYIDNDLLLIIQTM